MTKTTHVSELLRRWRHGDKRAADRLMDTAYEELRRLAAHFMKQERRGHTLQPTALVNEMYLKLFKADPVEWQSRAHFFAVAAQQLRRILVNHARDRQAGKRGGKRLRLSLSEVNGFAQPREQDLLELDQALAHLEKVDPRVARVIELRFFAGLTEPEIAEALNISVATLKRDWTFGRAWLLRHLQT
jgi:RNA polymerase sigma-70 factor (ECF subfamily)